MALNPAVVMPPLQQIIIDKTLDTFLANGQVFFWQDANRTVPKNVYTLTGTGPGSYTYVSLGPELTLSGIGSYIDSSGGNIPVYLWPYTGSPNDQPPSTTVQNYYITVYSSTGVPQFDVPNWPGISANPAAINTSNTTDNIISNAQFVDVDFPTTATRAAPFVISTSGLNVSTEIAPGWSVITSGTGSFSVYQQPISDSTAPGNPQFALGIANSTGYSSSLVLVQHIASSRIFAGQYVSATFIVESTDLGTYTIPMNYTPSLTGVSQLLCSATTGVTGGFVTAISNPPVLITNPGAGVSTISISITIPVGAPVQISCVQLCGVANNTEVVTYLQETPEREIDHLFHYFQPKLNFKPIPSLLTGWDFPLNPQQFGVTSFSNIAQYVWDQTIMCSTVGTINVSALNGTGALSLTTNNNSEAFYMLQYLTGPEAVKTTLSRLSVNINAYSLAFSGVIVNAYLFYSNPNGTIPILGTTIGSITNVFTGQFTLSASGWSAIPQDKGFSNTGTLPLNLLLHTGFSGWNGVANFGMSTTENFAIVLTFVVPTAGTTVVINSASCVPGDIPTRPAPQTEDEVLRECQLYYEISSPYSGLPAASGYPNAVSYPMQTYIIPDTGQTTSYAATFNLIYKTPKRTVPNITVFSANVGTSGSVSCTVYYTTTMGAYNALTNDKVLSSFWTGSIGNSAAYYFPKTINNLVQVASVISIDAIFGNSEISFNYSIDARLGIV